MLKANVGISRKLSKNYQSTGFTVNIEGELTAALSDAKAVIEQVNQLYDLAEEALDQQIERSQAVTAIADRDDQPERASQTSNGHNGNGATQPAAGASEEDQATSKQINFLLSIGKRERLSTAQLEAKIAEILGNSIGLYDLSKRQAGTVLDELTKNGKKTASNRF